MKSPLSLFFPGRTLFALWLSVPFALLTCRNIQAIEMSRSVLVDDLSIRFNGTRSELMIETAAWGPSWSHMRFRGNSKSAGEQTSAGTFSAQSKSAAAETVMTQQVKSEGPSVLIETEVRTSAKQDYTMIARTLSFGRNWKGNLVFDTSEGPKERTWPIPRENISDAVSGITATDPQGEVIRIRFASPIRIIADGTLRAVLTDQLAANESVKNLITVTLDEEVPFYPSTKELPPEPGRDQWFAWQPNYAYDQENNILSLADWSTEPAGSAGRMSREEDVLMYDGKPFKAWGLNVCFANCAPEKELADKRAAFYAANGINAVRFHKYGDGSGWAGILKPGSNTEYDPAALDRMDYFVSALKEKGIFVKLSNTFGSMNLTRDGWETIPYAREWGPRPTGRRSTVTGSGAVYLSKELQDLHIAQFTNLLTHTNPYTGMTYAEDPGIMLLEFCNEESSLFFGTLKQLQTVPTLKKRTGEMFTTWLLNRYGSKQAVLDRWGPDMLGTFKAEGFPGESLDDQTVLPLGNPWFWDPENIQTSQQARAPRLYDAALFLKELQDDFYQRMDQAVREAGYEGLVMASNWQAGRSTSHFYNLHSDAQFDVIDRHNYFGGRNMGGSMLRIPGGGSLSAGMQQVTDLPFSLSEWIHVFPNQWGGEGPAIIGAYGLGLQGWDISFMFQNGDNGGYNTVLGAQRWEVTAPQVMAPFAAIARQVRRMDVDQSEVVAAMNVDLASLHEGTQDFEDQVRQIYDIKVFDADKIPAQTLAVARTVVKFNQTPTPTETFHLESYRDAEGALISSNQQLRWMPGENAESGWFSINTPATQGVIGFAEGTRHELADTVIEPMSGYGLIYVTAHSQQGTLSTDKRLFISATARCHNDGMVYLDGEMLDKGNITGRNDPGPLYMEPVVAQITLKRPGNPTVYVCDHDGNRTGQTLPVQNGSFTIDGRETKTVYYEVMYP